MANHMRVRVTTTVDIDPEAWTANYGVEGLAAIRADVRDYCRHVLQQTLQDVDVVPEHLRA